MTNRNPARSYVLKEENVMHKNIYIFSKSSLETFLFHTYNERTFSHAHKQSPCPEVSLQEDPNLEGLIHLRMRTEAQFNALRLSSGIKVVSWLTATDNVAPT